MPNWELRDIKYTILGIRIWNFMDL